MSRASGTLGVGLGLRAQHYSHILNERPRVSWFEAISENYLGLSDRNGGRALEILESVRADYPVVLHGVSMSIGSVDPLDRSYLSRLRALAERIQPEWVSDHLCWTGVGGENLHDLLPLPFTEETLRHLEPRIAQVQQILGRELVIENVSAYLSYAHSEMNEWEFLRELCRRTGSRLLLDVNNVYVSSRNLGFDASEFLLGIDPEHVRQVHLAGHSRSGSLLIDTHDQPVPDPVWDLFRESLLLWGTKPTLIEWDDAIPEFSRLESEARKAERLMEESHEPLFA